MQYIGDKCSLLASSADFFIAYTILSFRESDAENGKMNDDDGDEYF